MILLNGDVRQDFSEAGSMDADIRISNEAGGSVSRRPRRFSSFSISTVGSTEKS